MGLRKVGVAMAHPAPSRASLANMLLAIAGHLIFTIINIAIKASRAWGWVGWEGDEERVGREEDTPPYRHFGVAVATCGAPTTGTFMEQWQQFQIVALQLIATLQRYHSLNHDITAIQKSRPVDLSSYVHFYIHYFMYLTSYNYGVTRADFMLKNAPDAILRCLNYKNLLGGIPPGPLVWCASHTVFTPNCNTLSAHPTLFCQSQPWSFELAEYLKWHYYQFYEFGTGRRSQRAVKPVRCDYLKP